MTRLFDAQVDRHVSTGENEGIWHEIWQSDQATVAGAEDDSIKASLRLLYSPFYRYVGRADLFVQYHCSSWHNSSLALLLKLPEVLGWEEVEAHHPLYQHAMRTMALLASCL